MNKIGTYRVYNIDWDTDGEDCTDILPTDITFNCEESEDIEDEISEWLSDTFGFCHNGFDYEFLGNP